MSEIGTVRSGHDYELSKNNGNEGSAARTRPFSMEEIMLRRKNKKLSETKEGTRGELAKLSVRDNTGSASDDSESKHRKDTVLDDIRRHEKESSRKRQESTSTKEAVPSRGKEKSKDKSRDRAESSRKQHHSRSRTDDVAMESEKKRSKDKEVSERDKNSEKVSKRKHYSGTDEKYRSKHDFEKREDTEYSERKGRKKESSRSHYEEGRLKRRRSRSWERERERDRDRTSTSTSPKPHKRGSYHGRDHASSGSGHYRGHDRHASGLGGYSPRKRKSDAAVRTPSPTIRSPERKVATWDLPPAGTELMDYQSLHQVAPLNSHELATPSKPNPATSMVNISIDTVQLTESTRPSRRLYVEDLPSSASDKALLECLNDFFMSSSVHLIQGTAPCISCIINKEKGQALVEFLTPEYANAALSFDGRSFSGSVLRIRRPKDFVDAAIITGEPEKPPLVVDALSDIVKDSPYKIFIGGISKALSANMLRDVVSAFGVLKAYRFEVNNELHESIAFMEYMDPSITLKACAGLNGMKLGGHVLSVVQAFPEASTEDNTEKPPSYGVPDHVKPLLEKPTRILKIKNVFNQEDLLLLSESELEETLEDVRLECARFGTIKSVNIVRHSGTDTVITEAFEIAQNSNSEGPSKDPEDNFANMECTGEHLNCDSIENGGMKPPDDTKEAQSPTEDTEEKEGKPVDGLENNITDHLVDKNGISKPPADTEEPQNFKVPEETYEKEGKPENDLQNNRTDQEENKNVPCDLPPNTVDSNTAAEEPNQLDPGTDLHNSTINEGAKDDHSCRHESSDTRIEDCGAGIGLIAEYPKMEETDVELHDASSELNDGSTVENLGNVKPIEVLDIFEPGNILIEYLREEAACLAAHCLHGRPYGDRIVAAGYVAYDLYQARFPR